MKIQDVTEMARIGRLYPAVIIHGGQEASRRSFAVDLARTLLCEEVPDLRACGKCRHCLRVAWPDDSDAPFHPDLHVLERDLKTSTSIEGAKTLVSQAQVSPYEARGQVFVISEAETLTAAAANALLKTLEEPYDASPRHFFLLAPSRFDLLPTLRSRSLSVFLGSQGRKTDDQAEELVEALAAAVDRYAERGNPIYLLAAAGALVSSQKWDDARDTAPWARVASGVVQVAASEGCSTSLRRSLLALAQELTSGWRLRTRGVPAVRVIEGLVSKHLASL